MSDAFLPLVDPELRDAALAMRATMAAFSPMTPEKLAQRRAWIASLEPAPLPGVRFEWAAADGVPLLVVNAGAGGAGLLHLHGGGYTASTARASLPGVQGIAQALGCTIVSVDYRLAPETRFDGADADALAGWHWLQANAAALGVDPARVGLLGESAGGGHAARLAALLRDAGGVRPALLSLVYPMLDDRTGTSRPVPSHIGAFGWDAEANRFGWTSLLGRAAGGDDPAGVPARLPDLAGFPPTWLGVGALDLFVGEGIAFARRLVEAGVPAELLVVPGAFHGFDSFVPGAAVSRRFSEAKLDALRRGLA